MSVNKKISEHDITNYYANPNQAYSKELDLSSARPLVNINLAEDVLRAHILDYSRRKRVRTSGLIGQFYSRTIAEILVDNAYTDKSYVEKENYKNLVQGSLRLINYVLTEKQRTSNDVNTLVFLDQSARPGAFLFYKLWSELRKMGKIPREFSKPNIIFINYSSSEKQYLSDSELIYKLLENAIQNYIGTNVLVIDESWSSGLSTKGGMRIARQVQKQKGRVIGTLNYENFPTWYARRTSFPALGLPTHAMKEIGDHLNYLPPDRLEKLISLFNKGRDFFCNSKEVAAILDETFENDTIEIVANGPGRNYSIVETVYYYLKTAGGLISMSAREYSSFWKNTTHNREKVMAHRELLAEIARFSAKHCELLTS